MSKKNKILLVVLSVVFVIYVVFTETSRPEKLPKTETLSNFDQFLEQVDSNSDSLEVDVSGNELYESYVLKDGELTVYEGEKEIWKSEPEWWVDKFEITDATRDGKLNIVMSVWKSGSFGSSKPFWKEVDDSVKNHFFVFEFKDQKIVPVWQSSNLEKPNCDFTFDDINDDGLNELVVIEGEYNSQFDCRRNYLAVWSWNEWGFYNDWRSEEGKYNNGIVEYLDQISNSLEQNE